MSPLGKQVHKVSSSEGWAFLFFKLSERKWFHSNGFHMW